MLLYLIRLDEQEKIILIQFFFNFVNITISNYLYLNEIFCIIF